MNAYHLKMIEHLKYAVTYEGNHVGTITMDGPLGNPMFNYRSEDGTVKGSVPEIKDAVRALRAWHVLKN